MFLSCISINCYVAYAQFRENIHPKEEETERERDSCVLVSGFSVVFYILCVW